MCCKPGKVYTNYEDQSGQYYELLLSETAISLLRTQPVRLKGSFMMSVSSLRSRILILVALLTICLAIPGFGQTMYAGGPGDELYQITNYTSSPTAVNIRHVGISLYDIAVSPDGTGYAVTPGGLYRLNLSTGTTALISNADTSFNALLAASDTTLYAMGAYHSYLYSLNTTTGAATRIFNTGFTSGGDLAFGSSGTDLYLSRPLL